MCFVPAAAEEFYKRNNFRSFWICGWGKLGQWNHINIATPSFSKDSVLKCFLLNTNKAASSVDDALVINLSVDRSDLFCRLDYTGSCVRDGSRLWINSRTNRRISRRLKQRSFLPVSGLVLYSKKITGKRAKPAGTTYLGQQISYICGGKLF